MNALYMCIEAGSSPGDEALSRAKLFSGNY